MSEKVLPPHALTITVVAVECPNYHGHLVIVSPVNLFHDSDVTIQTPDFVTMVPHNNFIYQTKPDTLLTSNEVMEAFLDMGYRKYTKGETLEQDADQDNLFGD